jgi:hypothetical protein
MRENAALVITVFGIIYFIYCSRLEMVEIYVYRVRVGVDGDTNFVVDVSCHIYYRQSTCLGIVFEIELRERLRRDRSGEFHALSMHAVCVHTERSGKATS